MKIHVHRYRNYNRDLYMDIQNFRRRFIHGYRNKDVDLYMDTEINTEICTWIQKFQ